MIMTGSRHLDGDFLPGISGSGMIVTKDSGDDWPGRIPAQMVAHIVRCFSKPNDLILDPMA